jgi:peptide/nickel transport system permease protein
VSGRWWQEPRAAAALLVLASMTVLALLAPLFSGTGADLGDIAARRYLPPLGRTPDGAFHLLGTDRFGRDLLVRLLLGARVSLLIGVLAALVALALGAAAGTLAGWVGGWTERAVVAVTDTALAVPRVPLLLLIAAFAPPGPELTVLAIGVTGWMTVARLVRAEVRALRGRAHVEAARALGAAAPRVLWRHVLPHAMAPALVATALGVGGAIQLEAGLSFLGLGIQPPVPSWGNLIAAGRDALVIAPWVALAPAAALVLVVLAFSLLADSLEAALAGSRATRS